MKKRVISILLSAAMISSMVVAGGVTAHAEENVTLNVFDAHAYGLDEYDEMVKAFEESHPGVTVDVQHAANDYDTLLQSRVNSGDTPDVFDAEAGTKAKMYYDYAYDWSNDTEVLDKFNEDAVNLGKDDEGNVKSRRMVSVSSAVSEGFIPAAGSSSSSSFGLVARARMISSRRCAP